MTVTTTYHGKYFLTTDSTVPEHDDMHARWFPDGSIGTGPELLEHLGVLDAPRADQGNALESISTSRLPWCPPQIHDYLVRLALWPDDCTWFENPEPLQAAPKNPARDLDFEAMEDIELLSVWAATMGELRRRRIVRSSNNPVGDFAEFLVSSRLGLTLMPNAMAGHDAVGPDGVRYQIKARRLFSKRTSRQLGAIRNLDQDPFDFLVVAFFDEHFRLMQLWRLPIDLVRDHATYKPYVNAHVLHAQGAVLVDPRAERLT